ncbi:MAG: flavodoxin [Actinomycetales bacterium]|nr:flavodoxin [Actinomycetales bacterium]
MKALVVYESMFGSTRTIAETIGAALAQHGSVRVVEVGTLLAEQGGDTVTHDVDLLVVGGPTHTFGMSRPSTRAEAVRKHGAVVSSGGGVREWLDSVRLPSSISAAAFDTRVGTMRLAGGAAAKGIDKWLSRLGATMISPPTSFMVKGMTGGLLDGQVTKAREWGTKLGLAVT